MPDEAATPASAPLILVVHDNHDARTMYSLYLQHHGFVVVEAANGVEAVEQAPSHQPALILMDLGMPHLDGWEATRRIKANPRTRDIPVLAITGHAVPEAERRAKEAGVDMYCLKPCPPSTVLENIRAMLSPSGSSCDASPPESKLSEVTRRLSSSNSASPSPTAHAVSTGRALAAARGL